MKKQLALLNIILALLLIPCCLLSYLGYKNRDVDYYYNNARVLLTDDVEKIESGDYENTNYRFFVSDLSGRIIFSKDSGIKVGETRDLPEIIQSDHAFVNENPDTLKLVFPVKANGAATGFAVFSVKKTLVETKSDLEKAFREFFPIIVWCLAALLSMVLLTIYVERKMLKPIAEISNSAEAIINGNLDKAVIQKSTRDILGGEMNRLCYSFESMRDELKAKAERENRLKLSHKELLSCMSHDLRTPISTIKAHAEALRDGLATTEEKREKYIATIINKTDVVSHMISDLLDHSNAECNQMSIIKTEFYITEYFETISKELEIYCRKYDTALHCTINSPKILISADRGRINQVIYNLIENAVKYNTRLSKQIYFSCTANLSEKRIYISVEDNGNGVSMSDISFVFDKFYRAEKSRSMQIPGAGLGLSICKYIVEAHGGEISLESEVGKGAKFTFYLGYE